MSIIGDGVDLVKALKEWKEEYERNKDKDLYIHRMTDLNDKLCDENKQLKLRIQELENPKFELNNNHYKIFDYISNEGRVDYSYYESKLNNFIADNIDDKIAYQELKENGYIGNPMGIGSSGESKHHLNKLTEVLKFMKSMQ